MGNMSQTTSALFAALSKFQGEVDAVNKDSKGQIGGQKYRYADLPDVWDAIRKPLSKHGLAVIQPATSDGDEVRVSTIITHASGEWLDCGSLGVIVSEAPKGITLVQARGSAVTYLRRYGLLSALGIVADVDDDGATAGYRGGERPTQPAPQPEPRPINVEALRAECARRGVDFADLEREVEKPAGDWTPADREAIAAALNRLGGAR